MPSNRLRLGIIVVLLLGLILAVIFSVRSAQLAALTPTVSVPEVQTHAVGTFAADLTQAAAALPTQTMTAPPSEPTGTPGTATISPTPSCYRSQYVRDVTIPDNTIMTPAQVFTKTWLVENIGTCEWRPGFKLTWIGGSAMGGSPFVLSSTVNPGARVELSVKMVTPTDQTGIVQGTWRMTDETGTPFGDALTVVVVVGTTTGAPPTVASTATP